MLVVMLKLKLFVTLLKNGKADLFRGMVMIGDHGGGVLR